MRCASSKIHHLSLFSPVPAWKHLFQAQILQAHSARHWMEQMPSSVQGVTLPPSLGEWIGCFSETNHLSTTAHLSPITLRLLLCHLQNQVIQLRSTMDTAAGRGSTRKGSQHMSIVLLSVQAQGVQELLDKWYKLAKAQKPDETATLANASNMMLYHLIMLNVISSFPEIERLARNGRPFGGATHPSETSHTKHSHHLENSQQIYCHCGQVLRHVRAVPEPARPPWWAGAVYRVAPYLKPFAKLNPVYTHSQYYSYPEVFDATGTGMNSPMCQDGQTNMQFPFGLIEHNITATRQIYDYYRNATISQPLYNQSIVVFEAYSLEGVKAVDPASTAFPHREDNIPWWASSLGPKSTAVRLTFHSDVLIHRHSALGWIIIPLEVDLTPQ